jgi:signal transduction histidine kinase/CheY-like chemotaxis protein
VLRLLDTSIKRKLMAIIMIASTATLVLVSGGFVAYDLFTFRKAMTRDLGTLAQIIGDRSTAALSFEDKADAEATLRALSAKKHIVAAALYDHQGRLFAQYRSPDATELSPRWPERAGTRFEKDHLILFHEISAKGDPTGTLYLKSDLSEMWARFRQYSIVIVCVILAASVATYLLGLKLQRIISRPILDLADTARSVSQDKNYAVRAPKHGHDELGQLIEGFNEMLGQIQERDVALRLSNDQLEQRVSERTQDLQVEIEERRRTETVLQQQFARISLLNQITRTISERQDTESVLHVVLRQLEDHLNLDLGGVALFDSQTSMFHLAALRLKNPLLVAKLGLNEGAAIPMSETGLQLCNDGQTVFISDTLKGSAPLAEYLAGAGLRSAVAVPLLVENALFGVLLAARLKPEGFSSGDCEFLRMLSEHVALAAHQARLHAELEKAYNDLRQTQATVMQQERLKALGQMASGIAHDVNNALSPVVGYADLLLHAEHGLSPTGKKHLKHIRTAGEDIAHIVARLREFYRRRDEKENLQELNLNRLIEQVVDMTRPRWRDIPQSRGVTIDLQSEFAREIPDLVGIESEIREAVTNLVLNAVDAMPNGGKITLRTQVAGCEVEQNADAQRPVVIVEVSDTGIGMSEEIRKRCLEPFFSTKGKRGTGLGLAMVYGVMERHEGKIEIESQLGAGSTFRLVFPVRKLLNTGVTEILKAELPAPLNILCIDDEPLLRDLLREMLERDGHTVEVSDGGQSGVEVFRQAQQNGKPFDLVITDLGMPYLDGRQVTKILKQESPATPVVMLTGWGAFMKEEGEAPAQVDGVLSKPPRSKELRETLCRLTPARRRCRKSSGSRERELAKA